MAGRKWEKDACGGCLSLMLTDADGMYSTVPQRDSSVLLGRRSWIQNRRHTQGKAVKMAKDEEGF